MNIELDFNIPRKDLSIDCRSHDLMLHHCHWQVQEPWRHGMARRHQYIIVLMEFAIVWTVYSTQYILVTATVNM